MVKTEDSVPDVTYWYEERGFVCFKPRSAVFRDFKTDMKSQGSTIDHQRSRPPLLAQNLWFNLVMLYDEYYGIKSNDM